MRGRDKLLEPVEGQPILQRMAKMALPFGPVVVTLPALDHPRAAILPVAARIIVVPDRAEGMAASLRRGVAALPPDHDILILPADMPDLTSGDIAAVIAARAAHPDALIWQASGATGTPGHPVLFHADLRGGFATLTGDTGARRIVRDQADRRVLVPLPGDHALTDLDTPEDWAAWHARKT